MNEKNRKTPFRELDHTADLRVEIFGKDEQELFRNALESLYVLLGLPPVPGHEGGIETDSLEVHGQDLEEALVHLLGEFLYRATVEGERLVLDTVSVRRGEEGSCEVKVFGRWRKLSNEEISGKREIKAVTYHDVRVRRTGEEFCAEVILDI